MLHEKKKNILVTTMSIFNKMNMRVNYYYYYSPDREKRLLCDGISSLEAGSKYILSKYPIDEILVIGTKETISQGDVFETEDLAKELQVLDHKWEKHLGKDFLAYDFYKYRIAAFLCKREAEENTNIRDVAEEIVSEGINEERKNDIKKILDMIIENNVFTVSELLINEKNEFWQKLRNAIQISIQNDFENSESYLKYVTEKEKLEEYQVTYVSNEDVAGKYKEARTKIAEDKTLTFFEKEFLYVSLSNKVNESIYHNEMLNKTAEIIELRAENAKLSYEIETLRTQRQIREYTYAKYMVYKMLDNKYKIYPLEENRKNIYIHFIPEQLENQRNECIGDKKIDNISGIVKALQGNCENEINLYIDMQGGNRTSSYVRNAALSILSNQNPNKFLIREIVATNYNSLFPGASEIVNETDRYRILDLASGMNAFIRYGKADMIQKYCEDMNIVPESSVGKLVSFMVKIDEAISLCDINALMESVEELRNFFLSEQVEENSYVGNIFQTLQDGIRKDYGKLLEENKYSAKVDYLELIAWCARKGFIQQALTLIEDKMPELYIKKVFLYKFDDENGETQFKKIFGLKYENRIENTLFYRIERMCKNNRPENKEITIKRDDLIEVRKELDKNDISEIEFMEQYCKFRRWEHIFEENEKSDSTCEVSEHEYLRKEGKKNNNEECYFSLIRCCGEHRFFYFVDENKEEKKWVNITFNIQDKFTDRKQELDTLFLLHDALKKERNCSNHASTSGIRLPTRIVRKAIEIYVNKAKDILEEVSENL